LHQLKVGVRLVRAVTLDVIAQRGVALRHAVEVGSQLAVADRRA
jgi:hypothetical protein